MCTGLDETADCLAGTRSRWRAVGVNEQAIRRDVGSLRVDITPEQTPAPATEEDEPLFGPFAVDLDTSAIKVHITKVQGGKLGDPDPGVDEEAQDGLVAGGPG